MTLASGVGRTAVDRAYNRLVEWLVLPVGDAVLRTEFMSELRRWRKLQHLSPEAVKKLQTESLLTVLGHASANVPFYSNLDADLGQPGGANAFEWLSRFPVTTKKELREHGSDLCVPGSKGLIRNASSGSTGFQSVVWASRREMSRSMAIQTLWWEWAGYRLGDRLLQTGITPDRGITKKLKDIALRTKYVDAFGLLDDEMEEILRSVPRDRRSCFGGYASSLDGFARVSIEAGINCEFGAVFSWGDKLFDGYRSRIRTGLGCDPLDTYGTTEGFMIASQRQPGGVYHVMSPHVVVELLDDCWLPVVPGEMGRVVVTRLDGFSMPLIRFSLGDLAQAPERRVTEDQAPGFEQLERIIGRETDVIRTPLGRTLTVHTFTGVMEHFDRIEQFTVEPTGEGLEISYIARDGVDSEYLARVEQALAAAVGELIPIKWKRVHEIHPTNSGKPQIIRQAP